MLLNGQRLFYFVALIATLTLLGCVDVPSNGPTPPNYRSSVKFFNDGRGRDTIAFPISKITYSKKDSTTSTVNIGGTDSVRTKYVYDQSVSVNRYRRYDVNFAQSFKVYIDGALKATIANGAASGYFDVASGNRLFTLKGNATYLDSIRIVKVDTIVTTYRDTIRGSTVTARLVFDTTRSGTNTIFVPVGSAATDITLDSVQTTIETERQYSMYLIGRTEALEQNENGLARFGNIQFLSTQERLLFQTLGFSDTTALVKFVHAFPDTGTYSIRVGGATSDLIPSIAFGTATGSPISFTPQSSGTLTFYVRFAGVAVDSVTTLIEEKKLYSIVIRDNAGTRSTQVFTH
jgi:hypothetical protein